MVDRDLFLARVKKPENTDDCWLWIGSKHVFGYGNIQWGGKCLLAHRVSYELFNGPIAKGMVIRHKCDVAGCVNPKHLLMGTAADNVRDRVERGRSNIGEDRPQAKLTWEKANKIRESYATGNYTQRQLAKAYGIDQAVVYRVVNNKAWLAK